ncbi:MAG: SBBP repeat-containing protein, partial [Bacteroidia bacterium]
MSFFLISQPAVTWAQSAGDSINESIRKLATDAAGNTYVVGYYTSSSFAIGSNTFTSPGNLQQMFIAKYDASGNVIWAKNAMGTMSDARCIVIDKSSNIYIAGIYFTSFTFGSFTLNSAGSMDIFLAKMDNNGSVTWVKSIGGASGDFASAITSDGVNNIYLTGQFQSNILTVGTSTVSNSGNLDIFTAKLDSSGNTLWLRSAGAQMNEESASVAVDNSGNVYVGGDFESTTLTVGTFSLANTSNGLQDLLLFKYDANGNVLWAKSAGSIAADYISAIVLANAGVYTTGEFRGPMVLGNN